MLCYHMHNRPVVEWSMGMGGNGPNLDWMMGRGDGGSEHGSEG